MGMKKSEAIALLGGTQAAVARAIGITHSAVSQWPDDLPATISDRVYAALWRMGRQAIHDANEKGVEIPSSAGNIP